MDGWDISGWCLDEEDKRCPGYEDASGVSVHEEIIDQFVMMRLAQILVSRTPEQVENLIDDACEVGNVGSGCLKRNAVVLKDVLMNLRLEGPERR